MDIVTQSSGRSLTSTSVQSSDLLSRRHRCTDHSGEKLRNIFTVLNFLFDLSDTNVLSMVLLQVATSIEHFKIYAICIYLIEVFDVLEWKVSRTTLLIYKSINIADQNHNAAFV